MYSLKDRMVYMYILNYKIKEINMRVFYAPKGTLGGI